MNIKWARLLTTKELEEMEKDMEFKDENTESVISSMTHSPSMEELRETFERLVDNPEIKFAMERIKFMVNPFVPEGEIWIVQDGLVKKILDVGNSRPFRFICWYQRIFKKLRRVK